MDHGITTTLDLPFDEAVRQVRDALAEQGFGILTEIDMQATLRAGLGEEIEDYLVLGACNPPLAHRALQGDRRIGLLLPCNVVVRTVDGRTAVEAMDPQLMVQVTGEAGLGAVADEAAARLRAALDSLTA
ncbi:DUF302 domain-containing protein [Streptomyces sp. CB01881]|uniref:DUF302 domain-containing protein n=1 Tax=Streptomyces sp. CB01881 TaxID=2078691 RepID=UPI000CDC98E8|nr:DUF302 domain-containing protein [Streptomyces sp. CB01881]AUY48384.1 ABC transporter [Streptomyces sp. CB01881]TYC76873.1 DUF302 domain-containing protein [Streptomyces sp. CB01881]